MKLVNVNVDQMQMFLIINNVEIKINADVNVKNQLTNEYVVKNLFGILLIVNVSVINHITQENIQTIKIVSAEKSQLKNQLKNVVTILMEIK